MEAEPNDARLVMRREAAKTLVAKLPQMRPDEIISIVSVALCAPLGRTSVGVRGLSVVLEAMEATQPSLERETIARTMDPSIFSGIVIREFLHAHRKGGKRDGNQAVAAGAIVAALRNLNLASGAQPAEMCAKLLEGADVVLTDIDESRRDRQDTAFPKFERATAQLAPGADPLAAVKAVVKGLHDEMLKDREELQALWWSFGGYSLKARKLFAELNSTTAAILAGVELASIVRPPASVGMAALVHRSTLAAEPEDKASKVIDLLGSATSTAWESLVTSGTQADLIRAHPTVFPVSAVAARHAEGRTIAEAIQDVGWLSEPVELKPTALANQVFAERALLTAVVA
jgi:hypothetical protein